MSYSSPPLYRASTPRGRRILHCVTCVAPPLQSIYYKSDADVAADKEVAAWWEEIRTKGHPDADPAGWPCTHISTMDDLVTITTTIAWVASAHHAAGAGPVAAVEMYFGPLLPMTLPSCRYWRKLS